MNAGLARQMRGIVPGRNVGTLYDPVRMGDAPRAPRGDKPQMCCGSGGWSRRRIWRWRWR